MGIKVTTSYPFRLHVFDQARQLYKKDMLYRLITSYPKFKTRQWDIPDKLVVSQLCSGIYNRLILKARKWMRPDIRSHIMESMHRRFSSSLSQFVPTDTDILIGYSSFMLEGINWAKSEHIVSVVVHGSLHERTARKILLEECEKYGFAKYGNAQYDWLIEKEDSEFENADYIMVNSKLTQKTMEENGVPSSKIFVNNPGVELSMFYPGRKADQTFRIIFCASMAPLKGVHYLAQVFDEMTLPESELWFIGSPPQDIRLKTILQSYMGNNVYVKGHYPQKKLRDLYIQGSVFVLPSLTDGWPAVVLQAMACGLPVIVTDKTGNADVVVDGVNGYVIPAQSVDALKEKLSYLYENPELCAEMGKNSLDIVKHGHSWDDYGDRLGNLLKSFYQSSR